MNEDRSLRDLAIGAFGGTDQLHALIDTVPDAMIVIDSLGAIISFSKGAERMFGFREYEVLGENVSILMPSPDRERHNGYISHFLETGSKRVIGMVQITVADSGPGIEPHIAERLFEPFQSTKTSGMGLGLSICHTIITGHGGRMWAEPSTWGGTAFNFTLVRAQTGESQ